MKIAIIGPGHIGGNLAVQFAKAGHELTLAFSRDQQKLESIGKAIGHNVKVSKPAKAVEVSDVVILSVPWTAIDTALRQMGDLTGKIVIDTTNQFGRGNAHDIHVSAAEYDQARMPGAKVAKAFNTLTAHYQAEVGEGKHRPIAMFFAAEDESIKDVVAQLISDTGFEPIYLGGWKEVGLMESPYRAGAVYGEAYRPDDAYKIVETAQKDLIAAGKLATSLKLSE